MRIKDGLVPLLSIVFVVMSIVAMGAWATNQLLASPPSEPAYVGMRFTILEPLGVRVEDVMAGSPAEQAGLQVGDVIYTLDGSYIDGGALITKLSEHAPSDAIMLGVQRDGQDHQLEVRLAAHPEQAPQAELISMENRQDGFFFSNVTYIPEQQVWQIKALTNDSAMYATGLRAGDQVTHIDGQRLSADNHHHLMAATMIEETSTLTVTRADDSFQLELPSVMVRMILLNAQPTLLPAN